MRFTTVLTLALAHGIAASNWFPGSKAGMFSTPLCLDVLNKRQMRPHYHPYC